MRIYAPNDTMYRTCLAGDESVIYEALRTPGGPGYAAVRAAVDSQLDDDLGLDALHGGRGYQSQDAGKRVLVAECGKQIIGHVEVTLNANRSALVEGWTVPGTCHPEEVLTLVADMQAYARDCGAVRAMVKAHVRVFVVEPGVFGIETEAQHRVAAEVREWTAQPIPQRELIYDPLRPAIA